MNVKSKADELLSQLSEWRRHLHMNPELSFEEVETSRFVAEKLAEIPGMKVETGIGYPTAVVGILSSGSGRTIAIRADMDALPIEEVNKHDFKSKKNGVMHACGHDAHTAIVLGTATLLGELFQNGEVEGTVKFLFQPAEEAADDLGSTGSPYLIQAGLLADVERVMALHMSPEDAFGEVKIHDGYSMASGDVFEATISGSGGHGAYPHLALDPMWLLGPVLSALHGIVSRRISPLDAGVISIGSIESGFASNVIPSEVSIKGTIRSYRPEVRDVLHQELEKAFSLVEPLGGNYELSIRAEDPALANDPVVNQAIRNVFRNLYPDYTIKNVPFGLGGEDFAHMTKTVPGAMFFLGCGLDDGESRNLHTPNFDIDERVLPVGAAIFTESARQFLMGIK
ncbi:M20 metallopeptidase family protein [Virgibacillus siamensis]|uniref:M20 metallopeptidase family protein n=1 Tax=Virgibacillus siamensis TaxID=480071 RepID=UPI001FE8A120|nr:amidohydrolase [Virgibacillus siamensis]